MGRILRKAAVVGVVIAAGIFVANTSLFGPDDDGRARAACAPGHGADVPPRGRRKRYLHGKRASARRSTRYLENTIPSMEAAFSGGRRHRRVRYPPHHRRALRGVPRLDRRLPDRMAKA